MHNTRSAIANLIKRYKAVLNKCHVLNTFGSLAVATMLVCSGVVNVHAATSLGTTEDPNTGELTGLSTVLEMNGDIVYSQASTTDSAYTVVQSAGTSEYTAFTLYSIDENGKTTDKEYEILLKNKFDASTVTVFSVKDIITSYLGGYTSKNTTANGGNGTEIAMPSSTYSIKYKNKIGSDEIISFGATNLSNVYIRDAYTAATNNVSDTTTNLSYVNNYEDCINNAPQSTQYIHYSGGALSIVNDQKNATDQTVTTTIDMSEIKGDFIGNRIQGTFNTIYQGNGGAIALFSNFKAKIDVNKISGDFIGNEASRVGGAVYLFTNNGATTTVNNITGDFIANTAGLGGGAIANYEGAIGDIIGSNFIGNVAKAGGGGAIDNMMWSLVGGHTATIDEINGDFIANTAGDGTTIGNGGAIRNFAYSYSTGATTAGSAIIGTITADFIANSAAGDGGAIYNYAHSRDDNPNVENKATITSITGDFIGNSAGGDGGAIYNDENYASTASIGAIEGDFINNKAGTSGGAIYNTSSLAKLKSSFVNNRADKSGGAILNISTSGDAHIGINTWDAASKTYTSDSDAIKGSFIGSSSGFLGGALYNCANGGNAFVGDITGDFVGNYLTGSYMALASGGAIANYSGVTSSYAMIGDIKGDFLYNYATKYGGAIYNDSNQLKTAVIGDLSGDFLYNYVDANKELYLPKDVDGTVGGGAIYNNDNVGYVSGSFIGNHVIGNATTQTVAGGAIYTTTDMNFVADDTTNYFSDNYTQVNSGATKDYNVIYVGIDTILAKDVSLGNVGNTALSFTMANDGNFVMNDSISGNTKYTPLTVTDYSGAKATLTAGNDIITIFDAGSNEIAKVTGAGVTTTTESATYVTSVTDGAGITITKTITFNGTSYTRETVTVDNGDIVSTTTENNLAEAAVTPDKALAASSGVVTTTTVTTTTVTSGNDEATYVETEKIVDDNENTPHTSTSTTTVAATATTTENKGTDAETSTKTTLASYDKTGSGTAAKNEYDVSTSMTGKTAYDIVIKGDSTDKNTFYLNAEADNFGDFSIENATLFLSSYTHENGTTTKGGLTAMDKKSSVTFGTGSRLVIDMSAYSTSEGPVDAMSKTAILTGNGASLKIDDSSRLRITKATTGKAYTIAQGFNVGDIQDEYAWKAENISLDSSLQTVAILRDGYNDTYAAEVDGATPIINYTVGGGDDACYFVLAVIANPADSALADTSVGDIIINAANTAGFGPNADDAGNRFIYEASTVEGDRNQVSAVEGAANIAKAAGVPTTMYRVNRLSSDALSTRLNGSGDTGSVLTTAGGDDGGLGELSKKYESTSLWFVPMYGHDVTDGAGLAGFDANFHTNIYGGVVGVDKTVDNDGANGLAADLYRVGVALNMGGGDTSASGDFDAIDNRFNFGGAFVYGVAEYGNLTLSADAGFNKIMSEINQDLSRYGIAGTKADVNSFTWSADLQAQYRFEGDSVDVIPYAGIEFVSMKTNNYNVTRADAAGGTVFTVESDRQNILSVPVGVKFDGEWTAFDDWLVTPQISLGAIFAMGDLDEHSHITMPNVAGDGQASMQVVDEITFDMSTGLSIANDVWTFGLDYELQMSEHRTGHALVGLVQYKF